MYCCKPPRSPDKKGKVSCFLSRCYGTLEHRTARTGDWNTSSWPQSDDGVTFVALCEAYDISTMAEVSTKRLDQFNFLI